MTTVPYQDDRGTAATIPAAELAPGVVFARVIGETAAYRPASAFSPEPSPVLWPPFPAAVAGAVRPAYDAIRPHTGFATFEAWLDLFRRDCHPWKEMALWVAAAAAYQRACDWYRPESVAARRQVYQAVAAAMVARNPAEAASLCRGGPTRTRAEACARLFYDEVGSEETAFLALDLYAATVPDEAVPFVMTDEQMTAFAAAGGRAAG